MALTILDAATLAAVRAATNQEAQLAALIAPWAGGDVTVRVQAGATLLATNTHAHWTVNTGVTPRTAALGNRSARTYVAAGTPTQVVFRAGSTDIFSFTSGVGSGDVSFAAAITTAANELMAVTVTANSSLPPNALPSWVASLTSGTFANIGSSTLAAARPTGWPTSESGGPFANWSGGTWAPNFGASGGYVVHGSGHLTVGTPIWAGVWVWDAFTATWVGRNVPSVALLEPTGTTGYNAFFESTDTATLGHPYAPHTYDGLVYQSPANGGGSSGSLIRNFFAGSPNTNPRAVHQFDLSSATAPPTRRLDDVTMGGSSTSYPAAALDEARGGYWLLTYTGMGPLKFVRFSDWSVTNYAGVEVNEYGDQQMIYLPPPYDAIVMMGRTDAGAVNQTVHVSQITAGTPGAFVLCTLAGTPPSVASSSKAGGCWSALLSCIVQYPGSGTTAVFKLTPPAPGSLTSGTWTWSSETLTGAAGATPADDGAGNGSYSRFIEVPAFRCFLWADGINNTMQAWRLTGM